MYFAPRIQAATKDPEMNRKIGKFGKIRTVRFPTTPAFLFKTDRGEQVVMASGCAKRSDK